jgi:CheY-like chemotaxis protein
MTSKVKLNCILLIDDSDADNFYNTDIIEACEVATRVDIVTSTMAAIEYLSNIILGVSKTSIPDLIFLDINMPKMNGFKFLEKLDTLPGKDVLKDSKIIVLTTSMNPTDREKISLFPAVSDYMHKPLNDDSLLALIEKYFTKT